MVQVPVEVQKTTSADNRRVWQSFRSGMDRMFDQFSGSFGLPALRRMFEPTPNWVYQGSFIFSPPTVDVTEDDKVYRITADVPGLEEKNIEVAVLGHMLTLKGEKHYEKDQKDKNRRLSDRAHGSFERSFALPGGVDRDKIAAELAKGVLTITMPKKAEVQKPTKRIEVRPAA
jgi:HSP20 family protein